MQYNRNDYRGVRFIEEEIPEGIEAQITKIEDGRDLSQGCDFVNVTFTTEKGSIKNKYSMNEKFGFLFFKLADACGITDETFDTDELNDKHCLITVKSYIKKDGSDGYCIDRVMPSITPYDADQAF